LHKWWQEALACDKRFSKVKNEQSTSGNREMCQQAGTSKGMQQRLCQQATKNKRQRHHNDTAAVVLW